MRAILDDADLKPRPCLGVGCRALREHLARVRPKGATGHD